MVEEIHEIKEFIPKKLKRNYAYGQFANNMLNGFVFSNLQFYYVEKLGANAYLLGIAWLIFGVWNTLNDPIASYIIDNTRTKIGRRIPYIRYGSVFYGLAFLFCWFPIAPIGSEWGLFVNFLISLFLLDTMFTIVGCCYYSLPNELAITAEGRASISLYGAFAGFFYLILSIILPVIFLTGQVGIHPLFKPTMILIAILCSLILYFSSFNIKENMFAQMQPKEGFIEGIRETLKNKPFWIFEITAFVNTMLFPIITVGLLYYIDYVITGQSLLYIGISAGTGLLLGLLTNEKLIKKVGPKKAIMISYSVSASAAISMFFVGKNVYAAIIPILFLCYGIAGALIDMGVLTGDVIDNDEIITGKRREAVYGGVNAIITKPAISIANWLFIIALSAFGFIEPLVIGDDVIKQAQTESAISGILFALTIIPAIFLLISIITMKFYSLDGPEWLKKKEEIYNLHKKKELEYLKLKLEEEKDE